jgi:hypothetical protein
MTGKEILDKYQEHLEEPGSRKSTTYLCSLIDQALEDTWNAAMKEAERVCREQIGATMTVNDEWDRACDYIAIKIEQSGGKT